MASKSDRARTAAYEHGMQAGASGKPASACQHRGTDLESHWFRGFAAGRQQRDEVQARTMPQTPRERAIARQNLARILAQLRAD